MPEFEYGPFAPNRNIPAQQAGEALEQIREAHGGALHPPTVVKESRPARAPLHPVFEWRDAVAAEAYRCDQASNLIRSVRVIRQDEGDEQPEQKIMYVAVGTPTTNSEYRTSAEVLSDEKMRARALADVESQLKGIAQRHRDLTELAEVFAAIEAIGQQPAPIQRGRRRKRRAEAG